MQSLQSSKSGLLLTIALNSCIWLSRFSLVGMVGFLVAAFFQGAMYLWGAGFFFAQFLVLNGIQTRINIELGARIVDLAEQHASSE
jgi:hypothetical protein